MPNPRCPVKAEPTMVAAAKTAQPTVVNLSTPPDLISRAPLPSTKYRRLRPPDPRTARPGRKQAPREAPCAGLRPKEAVAAPRPPDRSRFRPCQPPKGLNSWWAPCPFEFYREPELPSR